MILRRLTQSLKEQNWTAIVIEFVLLVVGVFLGIQVSNWNAARVDESRTQAYLERISLDLDADLAALADRREFWRDVSRYGDKALGYAQTGSVDDGGSRWPVLLAYFQASQVAEFVTVQATYDELRSAGDLELISSLKIRNALARYYNFTGSATVVERPAYRVHVRGVIPMEIQRYIWDSCYESNQLGNQRMFDCPSPVDEARVRQIVDAVAGNAALAGELRYWMSTMHVAQLIAKDRVAAATTLKQMIATRGTASSGSSRP